MIKWIIGNFRMLLLMVGLLSTTAIGSYLIGFYKGKDAEIIKTAVNTVEDVKNRKEVEVRILRKPKVEVQKKLEAKWCRDCQ